jgi:hypothetical protein
MPAAQNKRGRWVAIVTGAMSVLIGVLYLGLITVLDSRGPMRPPPPEALGGVAVVSSPPAEEVPPPAAGLPAENPAVIDPAC